MSRLSELTDYKLAKSSVNYTDKGTNKEHCSICKHYVNKTTCNIVAGKINPDGWCKRFDHA